MTLEGENILIILEFASAISQKGIGYYFTHTNEKKFSKSESGVVLTYNRKIIIWEKSSYNLSEEIDSFIIINEDSVDHLVKLYLGESPIGEFLLAPNEKAVYDKGVGFIVKDSNGLQKTSVPIIVGEVYVQASPSTSWIYTHNLGYKPIINVYDSNGVMLPTYERVDDVNMNVLTLNFDVAISGKIYR